MITLLPSRRRLLVALFAFVPLVSASVLCNAQDAVAEPALKEKWKQSYRSIAESIEMRRGSTPLSLQDQALLYYTNPVRTIDQHGAIFLWTLSGRPAVIGSIWSAMNRLDPTSRNVKYEWHSLMVDADVSATRGGKTLWTAGEPGVTWLSLPNLPAPAPSRVARLGQLRTIARRFTARITAEEETELRLMPQPLYRYPENTAVVVDGAIFAYSLTTDPELVLLVESSAAGPMPIYRVAIARFGNLAMSVRDGDRTIWSCERGRPGYSDGKYFLHWRAEQMPTDPQTSQKK